jgi:hypothetical protein
MIFPRFYNTPRFLRSRLFGWWGFRLEKGALRLKAGRWLRTSLVWVESMGPWDRFTYLELYWRPGPGFLTVGFWNHSHNFQVRKRRHAGVEVEAISPGNVVIR